MVDRDGSGSIGLSEFTTLHKIIAQSTKDQAQRETSALVEAEKQKRQKKTITRIAMVVGLLFLLSLIANFVMTFTVVDLAVKTTTSGTSLTAKGSDAIVTTAEATVAVPLYVAPVLPTDQLGALRWLSASHLQASAAAGPASPSAPPADAALLAVLNDATATASARQAAAAALVASGAFDSPVPEASPLAMTQTIFHIRRASRFDSTHLELTTDDGGTIAIKEGAATLIEPSGKARSLCVANVSSRATRSPGPGALVARCRHRPAPCTVCARRR